MRKYIVMLGICMSFMPSLALAQVTVSSIPRTSASLSIMPQFFLRAPMFTMFSVHNISGTESIDFGDGHMTGSNGCPKNQYGWCDLSNPVWHTYQFPGTYLVTLYAHYTPGTYQILSTSTVTVSPGISNAIPF